MSSLAARRKQRYRSRVRCGRCVLRVEVQELELTLALIESGHLTEAQALDRCQVEAAAAKVLDTWARRWLAHHK